MGIYMLGGGAGGAAFDRAFFNATLGDVLNRAGKERAHRLTFFLADGTTLEVCSIDEIADSYLAVRAYHGEDESCSLTVNLIPYPLIYRIEIAPKEEAADERVGFRWTPSARKTGVTKKIGKRTPGASASAEPGAPQS